MQEGFDFKIKKIQNLGIKPGLSRIKKLLLYMGNPEKNLKFIHVAGTNGKGSVCYMISNILRACSYKVGLFISPSIIDLTERMSINGKNISKERFLSLANYVASFEGCEFTEFEMFTAMALKYFSDEKCDVIVFETGMGGKLDSTNVIKNTICSIITTVSIDHTNYLGSNLLDIAKEKLGILKPNSKLVMGPCQKKEVYNLSKEICRKNKSEFIIANTNTIRDFKTISLCESEFFYKDEKILLNLVGKHQKNNICTVLNAIEAIKDKFKISLKNIKEGLEKTKIPCRIEVVSKNPTIIMDVSHNPESIESLKNFIQENLHGKKILAVFGMFKDKDIEKSLSIIAKCFSSMIIVQSENKRAMPVENLEKIAFKYNKNICSYKDFSQAMSFVEKEILNYDALIIFGSFSIINLAKKFIFSIDNNYNI